MPFGPPRELETFVGWWIPPGSREEVLGDLREKYSGITQYVFLALCVVPFVIVSRIRRTTDALLLLTEALLIYGSFLAAAWYTDKTSLTGEWGLLRVGIPTVFNLIVLMLDRAWNFEKTWFEVVVLGVNIYLFNLAGYFAGLLMVMAVEILFPAREVAGLALMVRRPAEPTKRLLKAAAMVTLAVLVVTGYDAGIVHAVVGLGVAGLMLVGLAIQFRKSRKQ